VLGTSAPERLIAETAHSRLSIGEQLMALIQNARVHPLTPLSPAELEEATALLRRLKGLTASFRFVWVFLEEPDKEALREWPDTPLPRLVKLIGFDRSASLVYEAVVSLTEQEVVEWYDVPEARAPITWTEWEGVEPLVKGDERWQEAMRTRGLTDLDLIQIDPWAPYAEAEYDPTQPRFTWCTTFVRKHPSGNAYAHPVDGLTVLVDLDRMAVIEVNDHYVKPLPPADGEYIPELMLGNSENRPAVDALRRDVKPLEITQPNGPSFSVDGHRVEWQKWSLVVGWTPREGLVLHDITYNDDGVVRPVLRRASISEMVVPYGDSSPTQYVKCAFDAGDAGLGVLSAKLTPGCDCLGSIHYFDGLANDEDGNAVVLENAICMHEEDVGIAWKHFDPLRDTVETRRLRRLVVSTIANVGNYEYGFFWYLYQDGSIELECKLNGIMQTGALHDNELPQYGVKIGPNLYAPNHQHYFCARLDVAVDGPNNTVTEVNSVPAPVGEENPYLNAWIAEETPLRSEQEAARTLNFDTARFWRITNPNKISDVGAPTAYRLIPGANARPMHHPDARGFKRMAFVSKHLWVTPARRDEMYAAGDYPWQKATPEGLMRWTQADRNIENEDIAVWYVFGAHHVPRVEEWPVMPVDKIGFVLKPDGFFAGNPGLDLPRPEGTCHHTHTG
jgi:primary-amine oxidase